MSRVTWLHLSDLHFRSSEQHQWDEDIVLRELLKDVQICMHTYELSPNLILVSGDIAFEGVSAEYDLARAFFDSLLKVTGLAKDRIIMVPGNHDVNRKRISQGAMAHRSSLTNRQQLNNAMRDDLDRRTFLRRFDDYRDFVNSYLGGHALFDDEHYFHAHHLEIAGARLNVLALNSAWLAYGGIEDRGSLALGEIQIRTALDACGSSDFRVALMHHPFDWLREFDRQSCKALLMDNCGFILTGHLHDPGLEELKTPDATVMNIAAGASYETREHRNSYNLVCLDLEASRGMIFFRGWSDQGTGFWTQDSQVHRNLEDGKYIFPLGSYIFREYTPPPPSGFAGSSVTGDPLDVIESQFARHSRHALDQIHPFIPGISDSLARSEIAQTEASLSSGEAVVLSGRAGTGKSGIGARLAQSAGGSGTSVLFIDARRVGQIQNESDLRHHFDLRGPFYSAIERIGRYKGCRFIIDQLDNVAGSMAAGLLIELAVECSRLEGVGVVVISRKQEPHEVKLVQRLVSNGFVEVVSHSLSEGRSAEVLNQLGISEPSDELVAIGRNLLNLELIGTMKQEQVAVDFSAFMDEVDLWQRYIQVLTEREEVGFDQASAEEVIARAVELARAGLNSMDRTVCVDFPLSHPHRRLISWEIIVCDNGRICRFRHEKLQDFLYAWDACQRNAMPSMVLGEIKRHRTRNVLLLMARIYARRDVQLHRQFLREMLDV